MDKIWTIQIDFKSTGPLTFRRVPSGNLHIMSYPFMPPTTMSGFLRRLLDIASGKDWPGYGRHWYEGPGKEFTWTLDDRYRALGAFPAGGRWSIHKTRRHGPKKFKHREFSQILRIPDPQKRQDYQLHHWDYLFCEGLTGWLAARREEDFEGFRRLVNFGGKAGKEGYVWVAAVRDPLQIPLATGEFRPLGLLPPPLRPQSGTFYHIYGHHWSRDYAWANGERGGVDGYFPVGAWWESGPVAGPHWQIEPGVGFAANSVDAFLQGDVRPLCADIEEGAESAGGLS